MSADDHGDPEFHDVDDVEIIEPGAMNGLEPTTSASIKAPPFAENTPSVLEAETNEEDNASEEGSFTSIEEPVAEDAEIVADETKPTPPPSEIEPPVEAPVVVEDVIDEIPVPDFIEIPQEAAHVEHSVDPAESPVVINPDVVETPEGITKPDTPSIPPTDEPIPLASDPEVSNARPTENGVEQHDEDGSDIPIALKKSEPEEDPIVESVTPQEIVNGSIETEVLDQDEVLDDLDSPEVLQPGEALMDPMEIDGDSYTDAEEEGDEGDEDDEEGADASEVERERIRQAFYTVMANQDSNPSQISDTPSPPTPLGLSNGLGLPPRTTAGARPSSTPSTAPPRVSEATRPSVTAPPVEEDPQVRATKEKVMNVRVKLLRLANRLGQNYQNSVVSQVLYRLDLAENVRSAFRPMMMTGLSGPTLELARAKAEELEASEGTESKLDFECTILVLGKTGTGKSATINSLFEKNCSNVDAFYPATTKVQEVTGDIHGIKVRVIDTPGLHPSIYDARKNQKILQSAKAFCKKRSPDIVLYFDRLDTHSRDYGDVPILRMISETFGPSVWLNALVVLTHGAAAPPEGVNGQPISYEVYMGQRSHIIQQTIRQAAGDMRIITPVSMAENHPACRKNRQGEKVLPNGQVWKPQLLLVCFASKLLAEANSYLKPQEMSGLRFVQSSIRPRFAPLPFLLSGLLQSRAPLKLPEDQTGDDDDDDDLFDEDEEEEEEEDEDILEFKRLTKDEVDALTPESRRDYFEALADFERTYQRKQFREEMRRRREARRRQASSVVPEVTEEPQEEEAPQSTTVNVPLPDMILPPSFDSDYPSHRYRLLDGGDQQWIIRPMLQENGWDHDCGYDSVEVNKSYVFRKEIPAAVTAQITKDKNQGNINLEAVASYRHGDPRGASPVTTTGFEIQSLGKDTAYTIRSDTRFNNFRRNKTSGGLSFTMVGKTLASGLKVEDRLLLGKCLKFVLQGGVITGKKDVGYGGSLEATLRHRDYPLERAMAVLGLSVMDWQGDLALGANLQSQFQAGKTLMATRFNINNRGSGQISIRATSNEQLVMALLGVVPLVRALGQRLLSGGPNLQMMDD